MQETQSSTSQSTLNDDDYDAIEQAVMETARGRWFLAQYAKRHRHADTSILLEAIGRLEKTVGEQRVSTDVDRVRMDVMDMARAIADTRREIAAIRPDGGDSRLYQAGEELDAIVEATEKATSEILGSAEKIQEIAWTLREEGVAEGLCAGLDGRATDIYLACSFQDITGQRVAKVVNVLNYLERRINALMGVWGVDMSQQPAVEGKIVDAIDHRPDAHLLNGPQLNGNGINQNQVDSLMFVMAETETFQNAERTDLTQAHSAHLATDDADVLFEAGGDYTSVSNDCALAPVAMENPLAAPLESSLTAVETVCDPALEEASDQACVFSPPLSGDTVVTLEAIAAEIRLIEQNDADAELIVEGLDAPRAGAVDMLDAPAMEVAAVDTDTPEEDAEFAAALAAAAIEMSTVENQDSPLSEMKLADLSLDALNLDDLHVEESDIDAVTSVLPASDLEADETSNNEMDVTFDLTDEHSFEQNDAGSVLLDTSLLDDASVTAPFEAGDVVSDVDDYAASVPVAADNDDEALASVARLALSTDITPDETSADSLSLKDLSLEFAGADLDADEDLFGEPVGIDAGETNVSAVSQKQAINEKMLSSALEPLLQQAAATPVRDKRESQAQLAGSRLSLLSEDEKIALFS